MRILVFVPALAALFASPAFGWTCPAQGGPEWREYKTAHFLLDTDMSRFKVEGLIKSLETMRGPWLPKAAPRTRSHSPTAPSIWSPGTRT